MAVIIGATRTFRQKICDERFSSMVLVGGESQLVGSRQERGREKLSLSIEAGLTWGNRKQKKKKKKKKRTKKKQKKSESKTRIEKRQMI